MISKFDIFPIGQIIKPHGIHGELSFSFTSDVFDKEDITYFIFEIQGIFVPFFITEYRFKTNTTALVKLDDITSEEQARPFCGLTIYVSNEFLEKVEVVEIELDYFVGFQLIDENSSLIGLIKEVDQTTENALFIIEKPNDELFIPVSNDYIQNIDHKKKIIQVRLPEGLLDL